ncbi:hypothetical protein B0H16DRAFT_1838207 [Mycena metata]|uniref:Uncharacterized protein n=1 Tax=Mycena metata TaxID=1033252 RepID=A0AAD7NXA5_9AGAR|nr:hypothetical protein B0H16DRAFT_1838207 [Mycena metata]
MCTGGQWYPMPNTAEHCRVYYCPCTTSPSSKPRKEEPASAPHNHNEQRKCRRGSEGVMRASGARQARARTRDKGYLPQLDLHSLVLVSQPQKSENLNAHNKNPEAHREGNDKAVGRICVFAPANAPRKSHSHKAAQAGSKPRTTKKSTLVHLAFTRPEIPPQYPSLTRGTEGRPHHENLPRKPTLENKWEARRSTDSGCTRSARERRGVAEMEGDYSGRLPEACGDCAACIFLLSNPEVPVVLDGSEEAQADQFEGNTVFRARAGN